MDKQSGNIPKPFPHGTPGREQREQRGTSERRSGRTFPGNHPKKFSDHEALTANDVNKEVQAIVLQFPTNEIAEQAGSTPRAIESVRAGENGMAFYKIVNLCRRNPRARAQIMGLLGCEAETDPDFVEGMSKLLNAYVRRSGSDV